MGMMESYPDSVHDFLCCEDPLSDSSSTGDNRLEETSAPPCMCAMAAVDPPPEVVPSEQTHTLADHREHMLANTLAHGRFSSIANRRLRPWDSLHEPPLGQKE